MSPLALNGLWGMYSKMSFAPAVSGDFHEQDQHNKCTFNNWTTSSSRVRVRGTFDHQ